MESHGYLAAQLQVQGGDGAEAALIVAEAFAGVASDGRPLVLLLQSPLIQALVAMSHGASVAQGLAIGASALDRIIATQVIDAGRVADGVGITATTGIRGYVREAGGACCSRCAILLGRFYRYSSAFQRHPYCQCVNVPVYGTGHVETQDPMQYFREGRIRGMSKADIQAVRDGADLNQVVNAHRGMGSAAGRKVSGRLMPEQIYREAANREQAIAMLRANGFLL